MLAIPSYCALLEPRETATRVILLLMRSVLLITSGARCQLQRQYHHTLFETAIVLMDDSKKHLPRGIGPLPSTHSFVNGTSATSQNPDQFQRIR